jgi:hypothetical protein
MVAMVAVVAVVVTAEVLQVDKFVHACAPFATREQLLIL